MRVVMVEPHVVDLQGFELRTFQCVGCGDVEKRPAMGDLRGSLRQGNVGTPRRALLSRRRQRSLDVPDVHQGEVRSHAPVIESLERASSHLVHAIGRLAEMNPGPNVGDYS